jgi:hypothetical protein
MNLPAIIVTAFGAIPLSIVPSASGALVAVNAHFRPYLSLSPPTVSPPIAPPITNADTTAPFT